MTPNKRLDQIEPVIAELLIKVDRIADGQGKILDHVVKVTAEVAETKAELKTEIAKVRAESKATIAESKDELKADMAEAKAELKADIAATNAEVKVLSQNVDVLARALANLTTATQQQAKQMQQGFLQLAELIKANK